MARPKKAPGYYDARRGLYCVDLVIGQKPDGTPRRKRVTAKRRADLEPKVRDLLSKYDRGLPVVDQRQTVRQWCEHYATEIAPAEIPKSAAEHAAVLARYVYPYIGSKRLASLTPADIRRWMSTLAERDARAKRGGVVEKLSPGTIAKARQVLSAALSAAVRDEVVARNVVKVTKPPLGSSVRHIHDALEVEQVEAVLATAARGRPAYLPGTSTLSGEYRPDRLEALAVLVLAVGLRQAEALDLRWENVDLKAGTLKVVDSKTEAGKRTIPLPAFVVEKLRAHRSEQRVERLAAPAWVDDGLVFASSVGTRLGSRNALRWWHDLTERAGVGRCRFHAARHTAAQVMLNSGVPIEQVSAMLGHASIAITLAIYARPGVDLLRGAADAIDATYSRSHG